jgi:DNA ligase-1
MWCWDMIPLLQFWNGICEIPYFDRVSVLTERMNTVYNAQEEHLINVLSATPVDNQEQAERIFQIALDDGQEGIIIKNGDSPWEDKRSKFQVKMKAELEIDLLVTDVLEGKGKAEGLIGSLSCKSKDGNLLVNVGSGLNDEDRKKDPEEFIGKIISVKYNEKIKDKKSDSWSLFLPIFQEIRLDKSEADNL